MNWKRAFTALALGVLMAVTPPAEAQGGGGRSGSRTTVNGGTVSGAGARVRVPGQASGRAGQVQATGANGGTLNSQGARLTTKQGGAHKQDTNWDGQNSSGDVQSQGSWKAGQGGQGNSSAEVTNKNTGETHSVDSETHYDPTTGGSTTVTTGNGTTKTVEYP